MTEIPPVTPLVIALSDPSFCPNGARHNSVVAGLVFVENEWRGIIRVIWNASLQEPPAGPEPTLKSDSVLTWREKNLEKADHEMVYAAWRLGAWDVLRSSHQPLGSQADPYAAHHGLVLLFDPSGAYSVRTNPMGVQGEEPDLKTLVEGAARDGWISWRFRPTLRSSRVGGRVAARDITLAADGTRILRCPYRHKVLVRGERSVIQLGHEQASPGDPWALNNQGATLRAARQRLGVSADGLAAKLRLGSNGGRTVRRWEAGEVPISGPAQVAIELLLDGAIT
jgi:DNA-binding transcriptional regulator YiaG